MAPWWVQAPTLQSDGNDVSVIKERLQRFAHWRAPIDHSISEGRFHQLLSAIYGGGGATEDAEPWRERSPRAVVCWWYSEFRAQKLVGRQEKIPSCEL
jgi:hypothetical protein